MNAASEQVIRTLGSIPVTASDLRRFLAYPGFCDCDVCERVMFSSKVPLQTVYYLKDHGEQALQTYVRSNWGAIRGMILAGDAALFPPTLAKAINEHIKRNMSFLEADLSSLQDEVADTEAKIEEFESLCVQGCANEV